MANEPLFKLNYPVETPAAYKFWSSNHKANKMKAIIAFSLDLENANDNLRRHGFMLHFRERALRNFCMYVNNPSMAGVPYSELEDPWYEVMPYLEESICDSLVPINLLSPTLDSRIIYKNPSRHCYLDSIGGISTAAIDTWPVEYINGVIVGRSLPERQSTNLLTNTKFTNWSGHPGSPGVWVQLGGATTPTIGIDRDAARSAHPSWNKFGVHQPSNATFLRGENVIPNFINLNTLWRRYFYSAQPTQVSNLWYYTARQGSNAQLYGTIASPTLTKKIFSVFRNTDTSVEVISSLPQAEEGDYATSPIDAVLNGATRQASSATVKSGFAKTATLIFSDGSTRVFNNLTGSFNLPLADYDWGTKFLKEITFSL